MNLTTCYTPLIMDIIKAFSPHSAGLANTITDQDIIDATREYMEDVAHKIISYFTSDKFNLVFVPEDWYTSTIRIENDVTKQFRDVNIRIFIAFAVSYIYFYIEEKVEWKLEQKILPSKHFYFTEDIPIKVLKPLKKFIHENYTKPMVKGAHSI